MIAAVCLSYRYRNPCQASIPSKHQNSCHTRASKHNNIVVLYRDASKAIRTSHPRPQGKEKNFSPMPQTSSTQSKKQKKKKGRLFDVKYCTRVREATHLTSPEKPRSRSQIKQKPFPIAVSYWLGTRVASIVVYRPV